MLMRFTIPLLYIIISISLDIVFVIAIGWSFPSRYIFSLLLIIICAVLVSCIPSRIAQISIFTLLLIFNAVAIVASVTAMDNLGEIFILENLYAMSTIDIAMDTVTIPWGLLMIVVTIVLLFLVGSVMVGTRYKKERLGFRTKNLFISICVLVLTVTSFHVSAAGLLPRLDNSKHVFTANLGNDRFLVGTFLNRHAVLQTFGISTFYTLNLMDVIGIRPTFGVNIDVGEGKWSERAPHPHELDESYNLIMLMMESIEFDAVNPIVTPNLWRIKSMSSWVDGYYAVERTVMTEYNSLVGSHVKGVEMWSNFPDVHVPQSLPNIFRRMEYQQVGAFHNWHGLMYNRDNVMPNMGFHFMRDNTYYESDGLGPSVNRNSDYRFFDLMVQDMAPTSGSFFSYILNVSTHHGTDFHLRPTPTVGRLGRTTFAPSNERFSEYFRYDIDAIIEMEYYLARFFPKLAIGTEFERQLTFQYLVHLHSFDRGVGVLLNHLETTPDLNHCQLSGPVMLIDTTAIVLYTDHFSIAWYSNSRNPGGGRLSNTNVNNPLGEKLSFMVFNPRDTDTRKGALPKDWRWCTNKKDTFLKDHPLDSLAIHSHGPSSRIVIPEFKEIGNRIERFTSNMDIFPTVAHLFGIRTHSDFTFTGSSIFEDNGFSVGLGFITGGAFFGKCVTTNRPWVSHDLVNFDSYITPHMRGGRTYRPCDYTIELASQHINQIMRTILSVRHFYRTDSFPNLAHYRFDN